MMLPRLAAVRFLLLLGAGTAVGGVAGAAIGTVLCLGADMLTAAFPGVLDALRISDKLWFGFSMWGVPVGLPTGMVAGAVGTAAGMRSGWALGGLLGGAALAATTRSDLWYFLVPFGGGGLVVGWLVAAAVHHVAGGYAPARVLLLRHHGGSPGEIPQRTRWAVGLPFVALVITALWLARRWIDAQEGPLLLESLPGLLVPWTLPALVLFIAGRAMWWIARKTTTTMNATSDTNRTTTETNTGAAIGDMAAGRPVAAPVALTWGVHEGIRGARWLTLCNDGRVLESHYTPTADLSQVPPAEGVGMAPAAALQELAGVLVASGFDSLAAPPEPEAAETQVELDVAVGEERLTVRVASHRLGEMPALGSIGAAFARIRAQAGPPLPPLRCEECGTLTTLAEALGRCESTWAGFGWAFFPCATCECLWVLELFPGQAAFGEFDEFPPTPDSFVPVQEFALPELATEVAPDGLRVRLGLREWFVPSEER